MKQFRNMTKLILVALMLCATLLLTACGQKIVEAEDANGTAGSLSWSYQKATHTLTVNGSGAIPNVADSAAVPWKSVRASVQKLVVSEGVTEIGDFAFYFMNALKEVSLPSTLTRIGKCAFAFDSSLAALTVPESVTTVGESAFEGCTALSSISLDNCSSLGDRAFAFCRSLEKVYLFGKPESIGKWSFKDCVKLNRLVLLSGTESIAIDPTAFEGAAMGADKIERQESKILTVTFRYEDEDGKEIIWDGGSAAPEAVKKGALDSAYAVTVPKRDGYTAVLKGSEAEVLSITGTFGKGADSYTVVYKLNAPAPETQPPAEGGEQNTNTPDEPKKLEISSIIAIVVMVVVLAAIGVGAFLLMRSDKKGNSQTVRKNDKNQPKKK